MPARRRSVFTRTWGCTLNQSDSDAMRALLERQGWRFATSEARADIVILNTCTVKGATENKILAHLRKLAANGKPIVVAGCLSANAGKIRKVAPHAPIVEAGATMCISKALECALKKQGALFSGFWNKTALPRAHSGLIARIPIQEGCASRCAFCQTKIARPRLFSYPPTAVLRMVEEAVASGAKEIQLTGMDTGAYGLENGNDLVSLLRQVVKARGHFRVRLGMINPQHAKRMQQGLLGVFKNRKMFKFLHIPVQTGSEKVCREMRRMHTVSDFEKVVRAFREEIPEITIATDVIVGYPTESDADYELTLRMLGRVRPDIVNLSKFTPRDGTEAKKLRQLDSGIIKRRAVQAHRLIRRITRENAQEFLGRQMRALIVEEGKGGQVKGRTGNYRQVVLRAGKGLLGKEAIGTVRRASHSSLFMELGNGKLINQIGKLNNHTDTNHTETD